jgi:putative toxin-antitoxin system antitoxin component (TIGR02293 family)
LGYFDPPNGKKFMKPEAKKFPKLAKTAARNAVASIEAAGSIAGGSRVATVSSTIGSKPSGPRSGGAGQRPATFGNFRKLIARGDRNLSVATIRSGVEASVFTDAYEKLGVRKAEFLDVIGVAAATFTRKESENAIMDAAPTERLARIADIGTRAVEVFGGERRAAEWLRTPNLGLGDKTPFSFLDTDIGSEAVRQVLNAIEYGGVV